MKRSLYLTASVIVGLFAGFLTTASPAPASADNCYDSGPTYSCVGKQQYECTTTKCCKTEYVPRHKPDGTLEFVPKETCRVTNTSCKPNGESCSR